MKIHTVELILAALLLSVSGLFARTRIDVLVVYTAEARIAAGGSAGIISRIDAAITQGNQAFVNSGADSELNLVHSEEISYTETGSMSTEITRLQNKSDGYMDNVHTIRNTYGADLVVLLTGRKDTGGIAGVGYLMTPVGSYFEQYAFSVTRQDQALFYTFIHEIGHNMGSHHDSGNASGNAAYPYSYGYRFHAGGTQYRTVMAYAPGTRIGYFSNPDVSYSGTPTGTAEADNSRSIRNTKPTVAAFREEVYKNFSFRAIALNESVSLRWSDPAELGYDSSQVRIRFSAADYPADPTAGGTQIYEGTNQHFMHNSLLNNQTLYYTVWVNHNDEWIEPR